MAVVLEMTTVRVMAATAPQPKALVVLRNPLESPELRPAIRPVGMILTTLTMMETTVTVKDAGTEITTGGTGTPIAGEKSSMR